MAYKLTGGLVYAVLLLLLQAIYIAVRSIRKHVLRFRDTLENECFRRPKRSLHVTEKLSIPMLLPHLEGTPFLHHDLLQSRAGDIGRVQFATLRNEFSKLPKRPEHFSVALPTGSSTSRLQLKTPLSVPFSLKQRVQDRMNLLLCHHYTLKNSYQRPDHNNTRTAQETTVAAIARLAFWSLAAGIPYLSVYQPQWHLLTSSSEDYPCNPIAAKDDETVPHNRHRKIIPLPVNLLLQALDLVRYSAQMPPVTAEGLKKGTLDKSSEALETKALPILQILTRGRASPPRIVVVYRNRRFIVGQDDNGKSAVTSVSGADTIELRARLTAAATEASELNPPQTLEIHLLDAQEGLPKLAQLAETLSTAVQRGELTLGAIDVKRVDAHMRLATPVEPKLVLLTGGPFSVNLYPAWAMRHAEIQHAGEYESVRLDAVRRALYRFAKCQQRFGK
ncbi:hypothetical protein IWQ60_005496 [Tieghemiomyces parasiticus]|uniref:ditrans,polycis-polyprenyl diphosphate synthase [(2E,6E)-farnesyldiphosphate specific] n=1 Tax=Tieghemiomyces parasiticus TaxID=78921 RepID=A0A9W8A9L1_9FUNG|nr:hypothetical protein IWQ60_005496 [Tieghemiomyces parasiticus]